MVQRNGGDNSRGILERIPGVRAFTDALTRLTDAVTKATERINARPSSEPPPSTRDELISRYGAGSSEVDFFDQQQLAHIRRRLTEGEGTTPETLANATADASADVEREGLLKYAEDVSDVNEATTDAIESTSLFSGALGGISKAALQVAIPFTIAQQSISQFLTPFTSAAAQVGRASENYYRLGVAWEEAKIRVGERFFDDKAVNDALDTVIKIVESMGRETDETERLRKAQESLIEAMGYWQGFTFQHPFNLGEGDIDDYRTLIELLEQGKLTQEEFNILVEHYKLDAQEITQEIQRQDAAARQSSQERGEAFEREAQAAEAAARRELEAAQEAAFGRLTIEEWYEAQAARRRERSSVPSIIPDGYFDDARRAITSFVESTAHLNAAGDDALQFTESGSERIERITAHTRAYDQAVRNASAALGAQDAAMLGGLPALQQWNAEIETGGVVTGRAVDETGALVDLLVRNAEDAIPGNIHGMLRLIDYTNEYGQSNSDTSDEVTNLGSAITDAGDNADAAATDVGNAEDAIDELGNEAVLVAPEIDALNDAFVVGAGDGENAGVIDNYGQANSDTADEVTNLGSAAGTTETAISGLDQDVATATSNLGLMGEGIASVNTAAGEAAGGEGGEGNLAALEGSIDGVKDAANEAEIPVADFSQLLDGQGADSLADDAGQAAFKVSQVASALSSVDTNATNAGGALSGTKAHMDNLKTPASEVETTLAAIGLDYSTIKANAGGANSLLGLTVQEIIAFGNALKDWPCQPQDCGAGRKFDFVNCRCVDDPAYEDPDPCADVQCPSGQTCVNGICTGGGGTDPCDDVTCPSGTYCVNGECVSYNDDPCASVDCGPGRECINGNCYETNLDPAPLGCSSDDDCPYGHECVNGECVRRVGGLSLGTPAEFAAAAGARAGAPQITVNVYGSIYADDFKERVLRAVGQGIRERDRAFVPLETAGLR